jgi:hypothetical protein
VVKNAKVVDVKVVDVKVVDDKMSVQAQTLGRCAIDINSTD